ncbi:uncharacterized protein N0V89_009122 [Didymosphaeria variabile]|uniref:Uncharacterized protein n=1 Tax=Didymosphaeria variabile TaxID=1932322 RepID=A0A9W8XH09_9PLEO|nr:uncharacterized protein N0V89_009122 [Didymosphaeria variabile]KAJ4350501.1 hypothetical protein N0V89_009122 [Didymosphaeria variabile]
MRRDLTEDRRKELAERFPGVMVKEAPVPQAPKRQAAPEYPVKKPSGLRTAVFELDKDATTKDDALEVNIRKQFPWATIAPSVDVTTGPRKLDDVEILLQDLATFTADYPPDGVFDVDIPHTPMWKQVPLTQRFRFAYARAIQVGRCGEVRQPATRCGHCKIHNFTCKVFRNDFIERAASTVGINLSKRCQHCRLLGKRCDLQPRSRSIFPTAGNNLGFTESTGVARGNSMGLSTEATVASTRPSRQPSLADGTSKERLPSVSHPLSGKFNRRGDVVDLGRQLGLTLQQPDVLWSIYDGWDRTGEIRAKPDHMDLQDYYIYLVDLNIMARTIGNRKLEFVTLLKFQVTIFEQQDLPEIDKSVIRAFKHLPVDAPLCRWIVIVFSYDWDLVKGGDYNKFVEKNVDLDPLALSKFLYGVAYIRDPYTKGGIEAVLQRFYEVHDHSPGSAEDIQCMFARRACENIMEESEHLENKSKSAQNKSKKRALDECSGSKNRKKLKRNGQQHGT